MTSSQLSFTFPAMSGLDLTDEEHKELVRALREVINGDRFPLSVRTRRLKAILDKLEPPALRTSQPLPAPKPPTDRSLALRRKRR